MAKVTKTTCELYKIRELPHSGWANITIDAAGHHGRIMIASDYGDWQYFWSHCGMPFKEFLQGLDSGYVAGKFGCGNSYFDVDRTVGRYKADIIERRRDDGMTKAAAREVWGELTWLTSSQLPEFCLMLEREGRAVMRFYDGTPPLVQTVDPWFRNFWRDCWPVLLETLAAEKAQPTWRERFEGLLRSLRQRQSGTVTK